MRLAAYQGPREAPDLAAGLDAIERAAEQAAAEGAHLLVTPEMSATGYDIGERVAREAEPPDGPIAQRVATVARRLGIAISYGYPERAAEGVYNATQVIGPDGEPLSRYRKTHLFGDLDRGLFIPGDRLLEQFSLQGLQIGVLTCYDVEFPEVVRAHALAGTELLIVPTGLMEPYRSIAQALVPTRAWESQVYIAYTNRIGSESTLTYVGSSIIVAPDGDVLDVAGGEETLLLAEIDATLVAESRRQNPYLADRRTDLYP
ncbi:nitrilase [Motilibacter rhizosphaerae]|uniref:Nitrilase n=1 Tax=Motilibacter rhizosphaerae TaxID=598652 RepID=A0A4Q7NWC9_9ACTN|nr:carbon-nitrogen hydrolase family protein [Motilibacter rhizosphaerae]RZS91517.1 nitrilase [Motilibacter rhizosphaerae]